MNLEKFRETYYEFSGILSNNTRKLAFAGIAIVWIFKQEKDDFYVIPNALQIAMLTFVISLSLDLLQYIWQTIIWGCFHTYKETKLKHDEKADFLAPCIFKKVADFIFWLKVIAIVPGYFILLRFLL